MMCEINSEQENQNKIDNAVSRDFTYLVMFIKLVFR